MFIIKLKKRRVSKRGVRLVYSIWYEDGPVFFGKTASNLSDCLRRHFFAPNKSYPKIDVLQVTKVLVQRHKTISDCALYVCYYVNKYKSRYNYGKWQRDELSINLPRVKWRQFNPKHMDRWREQKQYMNEHKLKETRQRRKEWRRQLIRDQQIQVYRDE